MAVKNQDTGDGYQLYNGDCIQVMADLPDNKIALSVYSPPFGGLYNYSSNEEDLSNCTDYKQFFEHYDFVVKEIHRITMPGRMTAVHCMEVPRGTDKGYVDFMGDIIRQHERLGFYFWARYAIWKEPLRVAIRTRAKLLTHKQIVKDSTLCGNASSDFLLVFKKKGENPDPVRHPVGLTKYCGEREPPMGYQEKYKNWKDPKTNKLAHWIWQQYASSFWDDIRVHHVLPYREARESEEEKHCHPLQLDVVERCVLMWSNPGDVVLTPFMGVGSEVYGALINGRKAIGIELKDSYYRQAVKNCALAKIDGLENDLIFNEPEEADEPEADEGAD